MEPQQQAYLQAYLAGLAEDAPQRAAPCVAEAFGDGPALADELLGLILAGVKTATCATLWAYEAEGAPITPVGLLTVVLDGRNVPQGIIETTEVQIRPFNQVDAQFAYEEGEGDRSLQSWRAAHWRYFTRTLAKEYGLAPTEEMPLVCERFRLVYPCPLP
jgi:uncharacterized protein YhfF